MGQTENRSIRVLGVTDKNSTPHGGKLDTFATCPIAVAALMPQSLLLAQVTHRYSSHARLKNSMESLRRIRASPMYLYPQAGEQVPGSRRSETEDRPVHVLGVPDENSARHGGELHALTSRSTAITALAPPYDRGLGKVHR
jgi:hypothetical protein